MTKLKLPAGIHRQTRDSGKVRYYWHPGRGGPNPGPRVRLPDDPHSPEFWSALSLARMSSGRPEPTPTQTKTISAMVDAYFASPQFTSLKPGSQRVYMRFLRELADELGEHPVDAMTPAAVAKLRNNLAETPAKANLSIKVMGVLYAWGREHGFTERANPAFRITKLDVGEHQPWPQEALDAIPEALPVSLARCCMLGLYTGQRLGDVLRMHRDHLEGKAIWVTQEKTGKELLIPIHQTIWPLVERASGFLCPKTPDGQPWTSGSFHGAWRRALVKPAGEPLRVAGVVFHGLRKNATVALLEAGCSEAQTASITGMSLAMVVHYGKGTRQRQLAREAMRKLEMYPGTAETVAK